MWQSMLAKALQVRERTDTTQYTWRAKSHFDAMCLFFDGKSCACQACPANTLDMPVK